MYTIAVTLQRSEQAETHDSIQDLISDLGETLTPTERKIAEFVVRDPTLIAFGSVSDLAMRAEASRPSVVRFATKLGFAGYSDLQGWVRRGVQRQLSRPSERIRHGQSRTEPVRRAVMESAHAALDALSGERLESLAQPIASAERVWVISGESSRAGAGVLLSGLSMIRPGVQMIEAHTVGRDLSHATSRDVAVVFDFARYRRHSVSSARAMGDLGVPIVAITDSPLSPLASLTQLWCELKIPGIGPFDSSIPAVAVAEMLVAHVVHLLGDAAREHIDRLEEQWRATETFLDPDR